MDSEIAAILLRTAAVAVGLVLLAGGAVKLRHLAEFRGIVHAYRMLPEALVPVAATSLPIAEVAVGAMLVLGLSLSVAGWLAALLFLAFAVAVGANLLRGRRHIDCGCFSSTLKHPLHWKLVVRSGLFALLSWTATAGPVAPPTVDTLLVVVPAGAALFAIHVAIDHLWALEQSRCKVFGGLSA